MDKTNAVTPHCAYVYIKRSLEGVYNKHLWYLLFGK